MKNTYMIARITINDSEAYPVIIDATDESQELRDIVSLTVSNEQDALATAARLNRLTNVFYYTVYKIQKVEA